jgi:hypothetical protein
MTIDLKPRTCVLGPALREALKNPDFARRFAEGANVFANGMRAAHEARTRTEAEEALSETTETAPPEPGVLTQG